MTDTCQTPGCGHVKADHLHRGVCLVGHVLAVGVKKCPCTRYTARTERPDDEQA